jgi:cbb3-type cytochrome oxidase cytochrome c subunit
VNSAPVVFLISFFALAVSWFGFVLSPQVQIGRAQQETNMVNVAELYPTARPGLARQGLQVYRACGCGDCHSQQVDQTRTVCDLVLTDAGTNSAAVIQALIKGGLGASDPGQYLTGLPKTVWQGLDPEQADTLHAALKAAGAKSSIVVIPAGPDIDRHWGKRRTVAADYLNDDPVLLGSLRVGPDLANVGTRLPDANWQLRHLYAPGSEKAGSLMPPYRFLFERRKIQWRPSPDALQLSGDLAPPPGYEIVPKPEATALVAYLLSLHSDAPLFEAPMTVAVSAPSTNAIAK